MNLEMLRRTFGFFSDKTSQMRSSRSELLDSHGSLQEQSEERAASRQHRLGKSTARERIAGLLDGGTFSEIGQFMGGSVADGFLGAAVITGIGQIHGRQVAVYAQDFSVRGGTLGKVEGDKIIRLLDLAVEMRIPVIALLDSGGARIQEGVVALSQYGRIFRKTCGASGLVPQISLILGPCAGGAVYCPALTDFIIMTKDNSHMFVTGPEVVKAATGEDVSFADLGGAQVHNSLSGVAHYLAADETDALDYVRTLLTYLPAHCGQKPPAYDYQPDGNEAVNAQRLAELVPASTRQPYDMAEAIALLVDYGEFIQVQELYAPSVVVGFGCLAGQSVGIVGNQPCVDAGTLDVSASEKLARFVRFCDAFSIPVVTLVDVPGYRPGAEQEQAGIIRRGAKVIFAYANATVPMVTVILRKAYGGAYIVMGSKSIGADLNFAWPGAEIAVLGAEGAVNIIHRQELAEFKNNSRKQAARRAELIEKYASETVNPNLSIATGELDALIDPVDTREVLVHSLRLLATKQRDYAGMKRHENGPL